LISGKVYIQSILNMRSAFLSIVLLVSTITQAQIALSLQDALSLAVKNNPYYKAEKYNIDLAKTAITTAGLHLNPSASLGTQMIPSSKYFEPGTGFYAPENRQMNYQVSKVFQVGGQLKYKVEAAKSDLTVANSNLDQYEWNLLGDVAAKWLDVWYAGEKLKLISQARLNSDTLLKINQIRLKDQVITTTEFSRTQINDEQYKIMQFNARQTLKSEKNNLSLMLGIKDSLQIDKKEDWFPAVLPQNYDSLLHLAMENRKEIQVSKNLSDRAKIDVALQNANAKPQPEVGVSYSPQNKVPYLGLYVAVPLPFSNRNQGEIARAKIAVDQAAAVTDAYLLQVTKEVRNAWDEYTTSKYSWDKYRELNVKSEDVLRTVKISYLKGGTTILDYLEAERTWFEMQNQYYEAMFNYRKSYLQLLFTCNYSGR
jgi:outer membrane protein, heavy metal efflux system